jgi:hypothetical protein
VEYSHHWWNIPIAAGAAQPPVIYAQPHSLPIQSGHPSTLIMHGKSYCYQYNLCWHTTATAGNTATGAGAMQPLALEQHSHHQRHAYTYLNNIFMASIYASNTSVIHITAMHPPLELCSHCWCYSVTTGVAQPPLVIPILLFLLPLWHFQYTTNSYHCNPTTSGAAQLLLAQHSHW